jgi:uncharacterized protein (TIGR00251 family)
VTRISVRVTTRAARTEVRAWDNDVLRVRLTAPPANGEANEALIALLADTLGASKASIKIIAGQSARTKIIDVDGLSLQEIIDALEPHIA